jgi:2-amino-4-hydroxy-6-hydroxymethyldihydropteridine diphosphokinase
VIVESAPGGVIQAYVAFGANLGEPVATLRSAAVALGARPGIELAAGSPIYRTRPIGPPGQPDYANAVGRVETTLPADALLDALHAVEAKFGRVRDVRWGPRTLDLDLIWYRGEERSDARLTLPHARAHEREFVLRPLADLDPGLVLRGRSVADWLAGLDPQGVEPAGAALM